MNGMWSSQCENSIGPVEEVCYNNEDDDCDDYVDEGCTLEMTCSNGIQDLNENGVDCGEDCPVKCYSPVSLILIASGAMLLIILIMIIQLRRMLEKKKEF